MAFPTTETELDATIRAVMADQLSQGSNQIIAQSITVRSAEASTTEPQDVVIEPGSIKVNGEEITGGK
jgi:hypothetical protein